MEEAWELAVMSEEDSSLDVSKNVSKGWSWSSKHTRLRYQLFVFSLLVFILAKYDVCIDSLPFGFSFGNDNKPDPVLVFYLFLGLYASVLMNFVLCSRSEFKIGNEKFVHLAGIAKDLSDNSKRVEREIQRYNQIAESHFQAVKRIDKFKADIDSFSATASQVAERLNIAHSSFANIEEKSEVNEGDFFISLNELRELSEEINSFKAGSSYITPEHERALINRLRNCSDSILSFIEKPPFTGDEISEIREKIKVLNRPVSSVSSGPYPAMNMLHDKFKTFLDIHNTLNSALSDEENRVSSSSEKLNEAMTKLIDEMNVKNRALWLQRIFESWVPGIISFIFVAAGICIHIRKIS